MEEKKQRKNREQKGNHAFNVEFATIVGMQKAVIANNYVFRFEKNYANNDAEHLERNRVFNSSSALAIQFPYMNDRSIRRHMKEMVDEGYFFVGNFNKNKYDQTKWYSPTNKLLSILNMDPLQESDEYYYGLDNPVNNTNGHFDRSNGPGDHSNGPGDRPIHYIEEDIEKNVEPSYTNFPSGKIGNIEVYPSLYDLDTDTELVKNNKKGPAAPKMPETKKYYGQIDYNILNASNLIEALEEVGVTHIKQSYILSHKRLLQALGEIKGDVDIIRTAVGNIGASDNLLESLAEEIFRINSNETGHKA